MKPPELPFILSPGLGCPRILSINDNHKFSFTVVLAAKGPLAKFSFFLRPSPANGVSTLVDIKLSVGPLKKIAYEPGRLPTSIEDTWESISRELFENVLEPGTTVYKVNLTFYYCDIEKSLRHVNGKARPTLYDLHMYSPGHCIKRHGLCLTTSTQKKADFIHLTDLHIARRNEIIKDEISNLTGHTWRLNQFNDNVREFVHRANEMADNGELDFVLMGGDLVDFVNHGVSDEIDEDDNNWDLFIDILTGRDHQGEDVAHGIKVPVFTTTGNHDWRLHPYDLAINYKPFGLGKSEAKEFKFDYYDTQERLKEKTNKVYDNIVKEGSPLQKESIWHTVLKYFIKKSESWQAKALVPIVATQILPIYHFILHLLAFCSPIYHFILHLLAFCSPIYYFIIDISSKIVCFFGLCSCISKMYSFIYRQILSFLSSQDYLSKFIYLPLIAFILHGLINLVVKKFLRGKVKNIISIEASAKALHYYFLHINPYFNYAFSYGNNHFIMMDTGPDCLVGQDFWDSGNKKARRFSVNDNIIGGAPDSMAFYHANPYYVYGQIAWLERVMDAIAAQSNYGTKKNNDATVNTDRKKRVFICLHAPPINLKTPPEIKGNTEVRLKDFKFKKRVWQAWRYARKFFYYLLGWKEKDPKYPGPRDARYGTTNHYVSHFLNLCIGKKENYLKCNNRARAVDMVFSGHAHQKVEFRVESYAKDRIAIYCGEYSKWEPYEYFQKERPFFLQTAAGGPISGEYCAPPYYRVVNVEADGRIVQFKMHSKNTNPHYVAPIIDS